MSKICPKCGGEQQDSRLIACETCKLPFIAKSELIRHFTIHLLRTITAFLSRHRLAFVVVAMMFVGAFLFDLLQGLINSILLAAIATVVIVLDYFLDTLTKEPQSDPHIAASKKSLGVVLLLLVWCQAIVQYHKDHKADNDAKDLKARLTTSEASLSNTLAISKSMHERLVKFEGQTDKDTLEFVDAVMANTARSEELRYYADGVFAMYT